MADVQPESVTWVWPGRIPVGKLVIFDGDPGLGKSVLTLTIGAIVSRGGEWPDGTRCDEPGDVLIMSAEDGVADTIRPRLDAANADPDRVHVIEHGLTLADTDEIERHITETGARLLVVDVLMAYMPGDAYKDQDVRKVLTRLSKVAERAGCTVLLLRHLNKRKGNEPIYRGGGSIGIVGAARAGFVVTRDPDLPEEVRILASVKNNLASSPKSLAYRLVGVVNEGVEAVRVEWLGEDDRSAAELFNEPDSNLGEMSCRVRDYVNSRTQTSSGDVADEFGMSRQSANQILNRLTRGGYIRKLARGSYGPTTGSAADTEDSEDAEDSEDSEDSKKPAGPANPHDPHDPQRSTASNSDASVLTPLCEDCGSPLGSTGKCVPCIVKRAAQAQEAQHPTNEAHQLIESTT